MVVSFTHKHPFKKKKEKKKATNHHTHVSVCLVFVSVDNTFRTTEPFVTKLGMAGHHMIIMSRNGGHIFFIF